MIKASLGATKEHIRSTWFDRRVHLDSLFFPGISCGRLRPQYTFYVHNNSIVRMNAAVEIVVTITVRK